MVFPKKSISDHQNPQVTSSIYIPRKVIQGLQLEYSQIQILSTFSHLLSIFAILIIKQTARTVLLSYLSSNSSSSTVFCSKNRMPKLKRGRGISQSSIYAFGKQKKATDKIKSALYRKRRKSSRTKLEIPSTCEQNESESDSISTDLNHPEKFQV